MYKEKDIQNKKVLLVLDLNEKPTKSSFRIQSSLLTIQDILKFKPKQLVLCSHYGRPDGIDPDFSMEEHAQILSQLLNKDVQLVSGTEEEGYDDLGDEPGVFLLENIRFFNWGSLRLAEKLSKSFDFLVFDAFGLIHRDEPYTETMVKLFGKNRSSYGNVIEKEIKRLNEFLNSKYKKFIVLGGKKIGDKIPIIESTLKQADKILIVGAIANVFYKAIGLEVGSSYINLKSLQNKDISLKQIKKYYDTRKIILPEEVILDNSKKIKIKNTKINQDQEIVDISPDSYKSIDMKEFAVFWNGNAGITEESFEDGTKELAKLISTSKYSVAAGGDTANWLQNNLEFATKFDHISTGGGAALEYIAKDGNLLVLKILK